MPHREVRTIHVIQKIATGQYWNANETGFSAGNADIAKQFDDRAFAEDRMREILETTNEAAGLYHVLTYTKAGPPA